MKLIVAVMLPALLVFAVQADAKFEHGIIFMVDGEDYYFDGAPDGTNGAFDIPGHYWNQAGPNQFVGKHYNTGPFGAANFWATGEPDGALLYMVHAIIDEWTAEKSEEYSEMGYVHYHEMVTVFNQTPHPTKVIWLKHTAVRAFNFDSGPAPELAHEVTPGIDWDFIPNWMMPYGTSLSGKGNAGLQLNGPAEFALHGAYPNPFNPTTTISYTLPEAANVTMKVFNLQGREVVELVNSVRQAGVNEVSFDASDLASGVYLVRLQAGEYRADSKLILTK